jgi:hypothetical protein
MTFFKTNLRIKSNIRNIINTKPKYNKLPYINEIMIATHVDKQIIHENNFKKNCMIKDGSNILLI